MSDEASSGDAESACGATRRLARFAVRTQIADLPPAARLQGVRAFVNWAGCVVGARSHESVAGVRDALAVYSGPEEATAFGARRRFSMMQAALFNSMAASVRVFEDTYLAATVHPTSPVAAAALAVGEHLHASGEAVLAALIVGDEITCRAANMLTRPPAKWHLGLYMTGIAGGIGAAVAAARLMQLGERETAWAIGMAVMHAAGVRALHGTQSIYMMAGNAARAGVQAALLARAGVTSTETALEAPRGFADVFASRPNIGAATDRLGEVYEMLEIAYKPWPCGVVAHAGIDGCLMLQRKHRIEAALIDRVEIDICAAGVALCGVRHPRDHMQCRNSLHHWAAVSLLRGQATIAEEMLTGDAGVRALRGRIHATAAPEMAADAARVRIVMRDGRTLEEHIDHCLGSRERPMDDGALDDKFLGQARVVMGEAEAHDALAACREIAGARDVTSLVAALDR